MSSQRLGLKWWTSPRTSLSLKTQPKGKRLRCSLRKPTS